MDTKTLLTIAGYIPWDKVLPKVTKIADDMGLTGAKAVTQLTKDTSFVNLITKAGDKAGLSLGTSDISKIAEMIISKKMTSGSSSLVSGLASGLLSKIKGK